MTSNTPITVVGGGLAGLVAAIGAAESGAQVDLHEAHGLLGGRARSTSPPYVANLGPHALYADGSLWAWLEARDLLAPANRPPLTGLKVRWQGRLTMPPLSLLRALRAVRAPEIPTDISFREWAGDRFRDAEADAFCNFLGVATFTANPGALSAGFAVERARRALQFPSPARYVVGGWSSLVDRLVQRARHLGVRIHLKSPVDALPEQGPVIIALELSRARALLQDDSLHWTSGRAALVDIGLRARRGDPFIISDLDRSGWVDRYSRPDPSLAPPGCSLVQIQVGLEASETLDSGVQRAEALLDLGFKDWRGRETWRRRSIAEGLTGALDYPGTTWRDRPAIDRGNGIFLAGDCVAAPGLLGEVSWASAVESAQGALRVVGREPAAR